MDIRSLKIDDFRGLHDLPALDFNEINVIVSPGNFGKTTLLQAIIAAMNFDNGSHILKVANIFKNSRCKDYDYFKQLMYNKDGIYTYGISAVFGDTEIQKHLSGTFEKGQCFCGEYFQSVKDEFLSMKRQESKTVEFLRSREEGHMNSRIVCPSFSYFDFEAVNACPVLEFQNRQMKGFIESYLLHFDEKIIGLKTSDRKFYIKHRQLGTMPAESLGSALYKCIEFSNFCDKNKCEILFLENVDTVCSNESSELYIKLLLSHITEMKCQTFITARNRTFGDCIVETMKNNGFFGKVNYINLLRVDDRLSVECRTGENTRNSEIL